MAKEAVQQRRLTIRVACAVFSISESCYRYESKQSAENELIADWLMRLTDTFNVVGVVFAKARLQQHVFGQLDHIHMVVLAASHTTAGQCGI
jgi:hypothetical protein